MWKLRWVCQGKLGLCPRIKQFCIGLLTSQDAQCKREALGVELYGFQQQLANLQLSLERSYDEFSATNNDRLQKEEELSRLKSLLEDDSTKTKAQRAKVLVPAVGLKP